MTSSHKLARLSVTFDDPSLIANAGLILPATLAHHLGVQQLISDRVDLSGRVGAANTGLKAMTVISALLAGAEWIDDVDVLRAGASEAVCGHELRAPSTIGTWLRAFTWGHTRQLEAAAGAALSGAWQAGAGPTASEAVTLDFDSTHCRTFGLGKQGGWKVDRHGERGYHPMIAVVDGYDQIAATRLREGPANDGRGVDSFATEAINRVRTAGAGGRMAVRADAGFFGRPLIEACRRADVRFSVTVRMNSYLREAIDGIDEDAWTDIPAGQWQPNDGAAQVAETTIPAFSDEEEDVRLVVRRVNPKAAKAGEDPQLLPDWRHHAFITDITATTTLDADAWHRAHAQVENVIKELKHHGGLAHLPSGVFAANAAWLTLVALAHNLNRWTLRLGKGIDCWSSAKTIRRKLIAWPARITHHARQTLLHGPTDWPWAHAVQFMLTQLRAIPAPT
ncbi:MAG: IS1380 family transposase [Dehalococcoidia bacterium]